MADISKINGVEVASISKVDNAETGNVDTILSGEVPAAQANAVLTSLTNDEPDSGSANAPSSAYNTSAKVMAFAYGDNNNSDYASVTCATASGATLSYGDTVVIKSQTSYAGGIVYNDELDRFMGAVMIYDSGSDDYNTVYAYAASTTTSGSGSPKLSSVGTVAKVYAPYDDSSNDNANQHAPEGNMCIYDHSDGASSGRMIIAFSKGGPSSGSSSAGDRGDLVGSAITITDVSSNNNVTVGTLTQLQNTGQTYPDVMLNWNEQRNKVVMVTQETSGTYQIQACTITGSGTTLTVNTQYQLDTGAAVILAHNGDNNSGSPQARFRMDNTKRLVYDSTNNCHHIFVYRQKFGTQAYLDFALFNFTVAANDTITWTQANGSPLTSSGIMKQRSFADGGNTGIEFTNGDDGSVTNFGGTSCYNTIGLAFSSGRARGAILGHNATSHSTADTSVIAWGYTTAEGYSFKTGIFEMFTNEPKSQVSSPSGTHHISDDGFIGKNLFFMGKIQGGSTFQLGAFDTGVGLSAPAQAMFSRSDSELPSQRSRVMGFGQSRIASMVVGGANTSGTPQSDGDEYNGSVFTASGNMSVARFSACGSGTLTAGLITGGTGSDGHGASDSAPRTTEEYDGSSFSTGGSLSAGGGDGVQTTGVQTDTLAVGGYTSGYVDDCSSYNGSSWTTEADSPVNLNYGRMAGRSHNDAIYNGGYNGSFTPDTYLYNGTSWSDVADMLNNNNVMQACGITTDCLSTGGSRIDNNTSEFFDGSTWTSGASNPYFDRYSPSNNIDCNGTFAGVMFGGGEGGTGYGNANVTVIHCDR